MKFPKPDFEVQYRFLSKDEGGRETGPPYQGYRCDWLYKEDDIKDGIHRIHPTFVDHNGIPLAKGNFTTFEGLANMVIVNPEWKAYHYNRIKVRTKGYFMEGSKIVAEATVTKSTYYTEEHAKKALDILIRFQQYADFREEYAELIAVLQNPDRWKEAKAVFNKIRVNITLPYQKDRSIKTLDQHFVLIAENAAKTAYNCSCPNGPFDNDSYEQLLECEQNFLIELNKRE